MKPIFAKAIKITAGAFMTVASASAAVMWVKLLKALIKNEKDTTDAQKKR